MGFFAKVWRFLNGYVTVTVEGFFLEKFTNLCAINSLPFWNVKRYGNAKMVGRTTINGFKQMRFQARKCGCRLSIGKKRGTPFFLHKYRRRKLFAFGFLIFLVCIRVAGMFVWNVEVSGNESVPSEDILTILEELGVKRWALKDSLDVRELANLFMVKSKGISWVGIDLNGSKVNVEVVEKPKVPEKIDNDIACDIVATKPALIVSLDVYKGTSKVSVGDVVDSNTVLVTGIMEMKQFPEKTEEVHALASIKGKVWYERTRGLKLSELRENSQVEEFAYKLAYGNILDKMSNGAEILNASKSVTYSEEKVFVTVTVESIEDIGKEVMRADNYF